MIQFPRLILFLFTGALLIGFSLEAQAKDTKKESKKEIHKRKKKEAAEKAEEEKNFTPRQKECKRLAKVMAWFLKTGPNRKSFLDKYYAPVIKGTEKAAISYKKRAEYYKKKAAKVKKDRKKAAEKAAGFCKEYAGINKKIFDSIKKDSLQEYSKDCDKLIEIEDKLNPLLGKRSIEREWFTMKELSSKAENVKKEDDKSKKSSKKKTAKKKTSKKKVTNKSR